jgi:P-type Ca2+ transporter type 2C
MPFGQILMIGISQVVGMIPEGLPVAMTIALAVGVQRMARRGAVVRRLSAVETLGSTTVICSDKTGTLTRNEMTVTAICSPGSGRARSPVTGSGYEPVGEFLEGGASSILRDAELRELLEAAVLCNDAQLQGPEEDARWSRSAIPRRSRSSPLAIKAGVVPAELRARHPRRAELPFDSPRR